jgi:8-oxo-dGTP pyrophosphatase MutT (NUDIX family)
MSDPKRWTVLENEFLQDCRVFRVSRLHSQSPHTGNTHPFFCIDSVDWVNVVPLTRDGDVVMIRQYRHGAGEITLEIPGGMVDAGEQPASAAARELLEETGFAAGRVQPLGNFNPNPALFTNRLHAYVAHDCERVAEIDNGDHEETVVEIVARDALREAVRDGRVDHALVIAALHLLDVLDLEQSREGS